MSAVRPGVRLGIDVGKARIGVARTDPHGMLATPVETVQRVHESVRPEPETDVLNSPTQDIARIIELCQELDVREIVVGLPLGMSGHRTPSTDDAEQFAERLAGALVARAGSDAAPEVRLIDERLSTVAAQGQLRQAGRKTKQSRHIIDQAAAVIILQHALDSERATGVAPGNAVAT